MAELRSVIVALNGSNYATWKVQVRMALIKEDVWNLVEGTEPVGNFFQQNFPKGMGNYNKQ